MAYFSIIIPLYNKAPYIERAIDSVLSQSCNDWELVVVNDGSTDDSWNVFQKLRTNKLAEIEREGRLIAFSQSNAGVAAARNNGVKKSTAPYICFIDADDWWAPDFLRQMKNLIDEFSEAGIYGANYYLVKNGVKKVARIGVEDGFKKGIIDYCKVYANTMYMPLWTGAVSVPRNVFEEMRGFKSNLSLGEDFDLWIRIALRYPVVVNNTPLAYYNQDVDLNNRAIGRLHNPAKHMLWNLDYLEEEERKNEDYKRLIDKLRVYGLFPYYLSRQYHLCAKGQLQKVDWTMQPLYMRIRYSLPVFVLRIYMDFRKQLSKLKRLCIKWRIF